MNKLTINRQNGNIPKSLPGEDHVSGILFYIPSSSIPSGWNSSHVKTVSTIDRAESLGIEDVDADEDVYVAMMHYHLKELFRVNPGIELYVGIFPNTGNASTFAEVKTMQNFANGRIRQIGIWDGSREVSSTAIQTLQTVCDALDAENAPLVALLSSDCRTNLYQLPVNLAGEANRVSVVIGQSGSGEVEEMARAAHDDQLYMTVGGIGVVLGLVSKAAVNEQIGWVKKFPTGISLPAFVDGTLVREVDKALISQLDNARYIFFTTYPGIAGSYVNDSHNMDSATSDYSSIEAVRTMDKAVRGIRTYVTPELGGPLYIDKESGKLQPYTVSHLESVANKVLEDMEKAGELSGYKVEIDPDQNVLSTNTVEILIKNVAVGVMRKININIGFYKNV